MGSTYSPLRYPGGKSTLRALTSQILRDNKLRRGTYTEPFAGGGGLALALLFDGDVRRIVLNDLDPAIWSFWNAVLHDTAALAGRVRTANVTMDTWYQQREVYSTADAGSLDLAYATLFLNRTNRSGVITGGVIGGKQQNGVYKLDCRFNREDLADKIERIGRYSNSIELHNLDGEQFLTDLDGARDRQFFFIDPPYYHKGSGLYANFFTDADHRTLAETIKKLDDPWVLTYDWTDEIRGLYDGFERHQFGINYSAATKRVGSELLVPSKGLNVHRALDERAAA
ncbi:DNA adenine methylase [Curtobacterium sp. NPDC090217]|uniref:DNA adenine methylase n=1 Tax=Curtobacterium sp. NPDC090217 TaxID=3363970 RepID=UPI00382C01D8